MFHLEKKLTSKKKKKEKILYLPKENVVITAVSLQGGSVAPSLCSESIDPLAINEGDGISLQNFVISFENAVNHGQCRSSSTEQVLCTTFYKWGLSTRDVFVYVLSFPIEGG